MLEIGPGFLKTEHYAPNSITKNKLHPHLKMLNEAVQIVWGPGSETVIESWDLIPEYFFEENRYVGGVRITVFGTILQNTGSTQTLRFRLKVGSTNYIDTGAMSLTTSANSRYYRIEIIILGKDSPIGGRIYADFFISAADASVAPGDVGSALNAPVVHSGKMNAIGVDKSRKFTLDLSAETGTGTGSFQVQIDNSILERII